MLAPVLLIAQQDTVHIGSEYNFVKEKVKSINEDGQTVIMTYINGKKNGEGLCYNPDGSIYARANFFEDSIYGKHILYHKNGTINVEEFFHRGIQHGEKLVTSSNGDTTYHAFFDMGKLNGEETFYRKGRPIFTATFEQGKEVGSKEYRKNGKLKVSDRTTEEGYKKINYRRNGNLKAVHEKGKETKFTFYRRNGKPKFSSVENAKVIVIAAYNRKGEIKNQFLLRKPVRLNFTKK